jgi:hypothetical protein
MGYIPRMWQVGGVVYDLLERKPEHQMGEEFVHGPFIHRQSTGILDGLIMGCVTLGDYSAKLIDLLDHTIWGDGATGNISHASRGGGGRLFIPHRGLAGRTCCGV